MSHSCLIEDSSCSKVLALLCQISCFMKHQIFSDGERFWTAASSAMSPCCCNGCRMRFNIVFMIYALCIRLQHFHQVLEDGSLCPVHVVYSGFKHLCAWHWVMRLSCSIQSFCVFIISKRLCPVSILPSVILYSDHAHVAWSLLSPPTVVSLLPSWFIVHLRPVWFCPAARLAHFLKMILFWPSSLPTSWI